MRSGSLRHPRRHFNWDSTGDAPRPWAQGRDRAVTDQDGAPDNGDWLSEFPAESDEAGAELPESPAARPEIREPLWTVITHESGPAWPAPPAALEPPSSRSLITHRAVAPAMVWLRARSRRDRAVAAAAIGAAACAGVILFAVTRGGDPVAAPIETTGSVVTPPQQPPNNTTTSLPAAPPSVSTRDRAGLDPLETKPPIADPRTRRASTVNTPPPAAAKTAPPRDARAANAARPDSTARRDAPRIAAPTPTPTATPAPPPPVPAAATAVGTGTAPVTGPPVVSTPPAPPRPTPTPVATPTVTPAPPAARVDSNAGARVTPPPAEPAPPSESSLVQSVLNRYRQGYSTLNADAVAAAWPSVNARSLARAFDQLESQRFDFSNCQINVTGSQAEATCSGTASFVPKVGNRTQRSESRKWSFSLVRVNDGWIIRRAESR